MSSLCDINFDSAYHGVADGLATDNVDMSYNVSNNYCTVANC